jgi:hypothetical protein
MVIYYRDGAREVDFLPLDSRQDGRREIATRGRNIDSIVFISSCQKLEEPLTENQVKQHPLSLEIKLGTVKEKIRADGALIRGAGEERVYLIEGGKKRWIVDSATFAAQGFDWDRVVSVSAEELSIYEEGERVKRDALPLQEKSLVRGSGPQVYLIEGGRRRWIRDEGAFNYYGFDWGSIVRVSDQELLGFSEGESLAKSSLAEGALVRGAGPKVYLIEGGKKRWIPDPEIFARNKFIWQSVVTISEEIIASYADGPDID